jgi:hypothetical protein
MKRTMFVSLVAFLILSACSKPAKDVTINQDENQLQSAQNASNRTGTPFGAWDNNDVLQTGVFRPQTQGTYFYASFPDYDFSPYFVNGETEYNASNYDVMTHFQYYSSVPVTDAVIEFTFPHILYFVPHVINANKHITFTVNNVNNQTVIRTITNLTAGWNPMFCFMVKVDCSKGNSGFATIWSDMKVNGVSVKGSIKNKVFDCN